MPSSKITFKDPWRDRGTDRPSSSKRYINTTMASHSDREPAGPSRTDRRPKKTHQRPKDLSLSLSPRVPPAVSITSPHNPSTARSMPSTTSPEPTRIPSVNLPATSPESFGPLSPPDRPSTSRDASSSQPRTISFRAPSAATVRGPRERGLTPPLTPFPPWVSDSEDESEVRRWEPSAVESLTLVKNRGEVRDERMSVGSEQQWTFHSILNGFILALQAITALAVFSALITATTWKTNNSSADVWLWSCLAAIFLTCAGSLIMHEARILTTVVLLYLQSAILVMTTAMSLTLWVRCLAEESRLVRGVLMGCNVFMWGVSFFGFVRGVVLWRLEDEEERYHGGEYGTFEAWGGHEQAVLWKILPKGSEGVAEAVLL